MDAQRFLVLSGLRIFSSVMVVDGFDLKYLIKGVDSVIYTVRKKHS